MTTRDKLAFACYLVPALVLAAFGIRYLTASEFMTYHAAALQRTWPQLSPNEQGTMLAALRGGGGGFLIGSVAILVLLAIPFRRGDIWAHRAVPALVILSALSALYTALTLTLLTPATAPWPLAIVMIGLAVAGYALSPGGSR